MPTRKQCRKHFWNCLIVCLVVTCSPDAHDSQSSSRISNSSSGCSAGICQSMKGVCHQNNEVWKLQRLTRAVHGHSSLFETVCQNGLLSFVRDKMEGNLDDSNIWTSSGQICLVKAEVNAPCELKIVWCFSIFFAKCFNSRFGPLDQVGPVSSTSIRSKAVFTSCR